MFMSLLKKQFLAKFFVLLFFASTSSVFASDIEELIKINSQKKLSEKIKETIEYVQKECVDVKFKENFEFLDTKKVNESFTHEDSIYLGGIFILHTLQNHALNSDNLDESISTALYMKACETAALLFSGDNLFSENFQYDSKYSGNSNIFSGCIETVKAAHQWGQKVYTAIKEEQDIEKISQQIISECTVPKENTYVTSFQYFKPIVLKGEEAIFSYKLSLSGVSKGYTLFGLTHEGSSVHGGKEMSVYKRPIELWFHDLGHHNVMMPKKMDDQVLNMYKLTADSILEEIEFECQEKDKDKALAGGYYLMHENDLSDVESISFYNLQSQKTFLVMLKNRLGRNMQTYFGFASNSEYYKLFMSDVVFEMVKFYPEFEEYIFKNNTDKALTYETNLAFQLVNKHMNWFYTEVIASLLK